MMMLKKNEITYLASLLPAHSKLSLFHNLKSETDGTEQKTLAEKGILTGGKIEASAKTIFQTVAEATNCTRMVLKDSGIMIEKYAYAVNGGTAKTPVVLVENDHGELEFQIMNDFKDIIIGLSEVTGMSFLKSAEAEVLLSPGEMMALLAAIDLYRRNALLDYLGQGGKSEFEPEDLSGFLRDPQKNSLVKMMTNNYKYSAPQEKETGQILAGLVKKKVFEHGKSYRLAGEYERFAANFLIPQTMVMLESFQDCGDKLVTTGLLFVAAGLKDICSFLFAGEEIEFSTVSGGHMLKIVENFLSCPDLV